MGDYQKEVADTFRRLKGTVDGMTDGKDSSKPLDGSIKEKVKHDLDRVIDHHENANPWPF